MLSRDLLKNSRLHRQKSQLLLFNNGSKMEADLPHGSRPYRGSKVFNVLLQIAERFGVRTSIHGMDRVVDRCLSRKERFVWSLALLFAFGVLIYVCLLLAARYQRKQLDTVIDSTKYPVYKLPFPEVTICNRNRLNWARLGEAKELYLDAQHRTPELEAVFEDVLQRFDDFGYDQFNVFANLSDSAALATLDYVNITAVVDHLAWRCDEFLEECHWQHGAVNCCDVFFPRHSQTGRCLSFNSLESEEARRKSHTDKYWPWRVGDYGPGSALVVRLALRVRHHAPGSHHEKGAMFMLTEPHIWYSIPFQVGAYTHSAISINTNVNFYENDTRSMPPEQRGCIFNNEVEKSKYRTLPGRTFNFENCQSECQRQAVRGACNCSLELLFPPGPARTTTTTTTTTATRTAKAARSSAQGQLTACKLSDLPCLGQKHDELQLFTRIEGKSPAAPTKGGSAVGVGGGGVIGGGHHTCPCLLNCVRVQYMPDVRTTPLSAMERAEHEPFVELDLYFRRSFTLSYKTAMVFTWVDLLVSFGGVAGLFLGCSLISLCEMAYFFLVDMPQCVMEGPHPPWTSMGHRQPHNTNLDGRPAEGFSRPRRFLRNY